MNILINKVNLMIKKISDENILDSLINLEKIISRILNLCKNKNKIFLMNLKL